MVHQDKDSILSEYYLGIKGNNLLIKATAEAFNTPYCQLKSKEEL